MEEIRQINTMVDFKKKEAMEYADSLVEELSRELNIGVYPEEANLFLVIGGDGTMLEANQQYWVYGVPLLGLDFGYKGFLMNQAKEPKEVAEMILSQKFKIYRFPLLKIETDSSSKMFTALNDVYFNRIIGKSCKFNVKVNGIQVAPERITGDGFVVSTALGSTGYNFAAKGAAIYPELPVISLAPVSLHAPIQLKSMIFPLNSQIEIEILNLYERDIAGWYDGFDLPPFKRLKITGGDCWTKLAFWPEENFTERLITKIMKVQEEKDV